MTIKDDGLIEADYRTDTAPPVKVRVSSDLKPTDRQREVGRLLIKALRQFAAGIGTLVVAAGMLYGVSAEGN